VNEFQKAITEPARDETLAQLRREISQLTGEQPR
jgi:hypothetical protein